MDRWGKHLGIIIITSCSKLHEMALAHEINSSKLQENVHTLTSDYDSTRSQLETTQASNTQLQQKVIK